MSKNAAHDRWWQTSEVIFGVPFLAAVVVQLAVPLSFPGGSLVPVIGIAGAVLMLAGVALIALARREFAQHGQPTDPGRPTSSIVTTGVFSVSRNPIYLGAACFLAGIALAFDLPWVLLLLLPALIACYFVLIAPEETYLAARFGDEYRRYCASVPRWIGRTRRPG